MATHPTQYAHPEALVETDWLEKHLKDDGIRIVESNEDVLLYDTGHIPGAVHIDWRADLQDNVIRDYIKPEKFAELCSRNGITPETTCIFYGDKANWWACYALWAFRLFGHEKVKILNGGRDKWKAEQRPMTRDIPKYPRTNYPVPKKRFDKEIRAFADEALAQSKSKKPLIDVRSPGEYKGEITHMPEYPQEGVLRGGHIPGAKSMPWKTARLSKRARSAGVSPAGFAGQDAHLPHRQDVRATGEIRGIRGRFLVIVDVSDPAQQDHQSLRLAPGR